VNGLIIRLMFISIKVFFKTVALKINLKDRDRRISIKCNFERSP
jgi:hypothetical protein